MMMTILLSALLQARQNPSPMVEHIREHRRLTERPPSGDRWDLRRGRLFVPAALNRKKPATLVIHFHGAPWIAEQAAARRRQTAAVAVHIGAGSAVYSREFEDKSLFAALLDEAAARSGVRFNRVLLTSYSAGYGAIRKILEDPANWARIDGVLTADSIHAGYATGSPGPLESSLTADNLAAFTAFARQAVAGRKRMLVTHSEIFPGTFASTTETADFLLKQLGLRRKPVLRWGPMGMQQLAETRRGRFAVLAYAGNSAPDHVDHLHSLPELLALLERLR